MGDVAIKVTLGGAEVFSGTCDGPWLLMNLDPGTYAVTAEFEGQRRDVNVTVGRKAAQKTIVFRTAS